MEQKRIDEICPYVRMTRWKRQKVILCDENYGKSPEPFQLSIDVLGGKVNVREGGICLATTLYEGNKSPKVKLDVNEMYRCCYRTGLNDK